MNTDDLVRKEITLWNDDSTSISPPMQLEIGVGSWQLYLTAVNRFAESKPSNTVLLDIVPGEPAAPLNVIIQLVAAPVQSTYSTNSVNRSTITLQRLPAKVQGVKTETTTDWSKVKVIEK